MLSVLVRAHVQMSNMHRAKRHLFVPYGKTRGTVLDIFRNTLLDVSVMSGWKGSVTYGLDADISVSNCLGDRYLKLGLRK